MRYVMITGASSGIGYELAKIYFVEGYSLVLVGRDMDRLNGAKRNLEGSRTYKQGQEIKIYLKDLSADNAGVELYREIKQDGLIIDILINNAGAGYVGEFKDIEFDKHREISRLNIDTVTQLTYYIGNDMCERRSGKIVNVASTGSYHPGAYIGLYYASKAYVLSLSEALNKEMKPYGVTVSALCPGATSTRFSERAGRRETKLGMRPEFVARKAFKGICKNKKVIVPGVRNKFFIRLPRNIAAYFVARYQKKLQK